MTRDHGATRGNGDGSRPSGAAMHVVCTAGHVDHGKSSLVTALTGMQPDRLAEERRRGLTIDLGFGWFDLDADTTVAFVDLPGHERFVPTMLAGAGPVGIALFVVDASEGWMPQSAEHLAILDLLGVRHGVVALTKADTVDAETVELAELELREHLDQTALATAQVVATSARTGRGLDTLRAALGAACRRAGAASDRGRPRLWIDRSFTVRGAGTVVTGTLAGGAFATGDDVVVLPAGRKGRARGLQSLERDHPRVEPGSRVAVNVSGVDVASVGRGDALVLPGQWRPTAVLDVWLRVVHGGRVRHTGAWHLHIGSSEHVVTVRPLGAREMLGGQQGPVRVTLRSPTIAEVGDRVVLREVGRGITVAGGPVLDPAPLSLPRGRMARAQRTEQLHARFEALGDPADLGDLGDLDDLGDRATLLALHVAERGAVRRDDAQAAVGVHPTSPPTGTVVMADHYVDRTALDRWTTAIHDALTTAHEYQPLAQVAPRAVVDRAATTAGCPPELCDAVLADAEASGVIGRADGGVRLPHHRVTFDAAQRDQRDRIVALLDETPFAPPGLSDIARDIGASPALLAALQADGTLVRLTNDMALTSRAFDAAVDALRAAVERHGALTASDARTVLDTSRKYALPLLEELDRRGVTQRIGDTRVFRDQR